MKKINKGGRPIIKHKKDQQLSTMVTLLDRKILERNAAKAQITVSEYLRMQGLKEKINVKIITLPAEVLQLKGLLNHIAANINQATSKLNALNVITTKELIFFKEIIQQIKEVTILINQYCK